MTGLLPEIRLHSFPPTSITARSKHATLLDWDLFLGKKHIQMGHVHATVAMHKMHVWPTESQFLGTGLPCAFGMFGVLRLKRECTRNFHVQRQPIEQCWQVGCMQPWR